MQNLRNTDKNQRLGAEPEWRDSGWTRGKQWSQEANGQNPLALPSTPGSSEVTIYNTLANTYKCRTP